MKKLRFITIFVLIIGLIFISTTSVVAAKGGQGQENRPEGKGRPEFIDNVVGLVKSAPYVTKFPEPPVVSGGNCFFEKGDAIYRRLSFSEISHWIDIAYIGNPMQAMLLKKIVQRFKKMGHAGLYYKWKPDEFSDPAIRFNHTTIESLTRDNRGPSISDFQTFLDTEDFWGVRTSNKLDYKKRQTIIERAESQIKPGIKYNFFSGYKSPGVSFRCDGLVEWCYEQVGIDIVPNPDWWCVKKGYNLLAPNIQMRNLQEYPEDEDHFPTLTFGKYDEQGEKIYGPIEIKGEEVLPEDGKYEVYGAEVKIKIYASDIDEDDDGSGITRLELWIGEPDDTPDEMPGLRFPRKDTDYPADNDYIFTWDTTELPNDDYTLKVIAFDQAGNIESAYCEVEIVSIRITELMRAINERQKAAGRTQTVFYNRTTGESLGVPDGGVNVPALDALDGYPILAQYIMDLRGPIQQIYSNFLVPNTYGTWPNFGEFYKAAMGTTGSGPGNDTWTHSQSEMEIMGIQDIDIEEIVKCLNKMEYFFIRESRQTGDFTTLKKFGTSYNSAIEAWNNTLISSPIQESYVGVAWYLDKWGARWTGYIRRGYKTIPTSRLSGHLVLDTQARIGSHSASSPDSLSRICEMHRVDWIPSNPSWDFSNIAGSWLAYEREPYFRYIDLDSAIIRNDGDTRFAFKMKDDHEFPGENFPTRVTSVLAYFGLRLKVRWNYPKSP